MNDGEPRKGNYYAWSTKQNGAVPEIIRAPVGGALLVSTRRDELERPSVLHQVHRVADTQDTPVYLVQLAEVETCAVIWPADAQAVQRGGRGEPT